MTILFLIAFAFPHNSGEFGHFCAPVIGLESGRDCVYEGLIFFTPMLEPKKQFIALIAGEIINLIIFRQKVVYRHYTTEREKQLAYTAWVSWSTIRTGIFFLHLWKAKKQTHTKEDL